MDTFDQKQAAAKIRVVGVGGGGCNAVNTMIAAKPRAGGLHRRQHRHPGAGGQQGADARSRSAPTLTKGLGAGANPEMGREAALESQGRRSPRRSRARTWCSSPRAWAAAPAPARRRSSPTSPRAWAALTVGVVTKPFLFEGNKRRKQAEQGLVELKAAVDTLITIPNQRLLTLSQRADAAARHLQARRRGAAQRRAGHQRPHPVPRLHQRRLRRREDHHERQGPGADGHRPRRRRQARAAAPCSRRSPARCSRTSPSTAPPACSSTSPAAAT